MHHADGVTLYISTATWWQSHSHKGVVLDEEAAVLDRQVRLALAVVRRAGDRRCESAAGVCVDQDAVLGQLLLAQDDLLCALRRPSMTSRQGNPLSRPVRVTVSRAQDFDL